MHDALVLYNTLKKNYANVELPVGSVFWREPLHRFGTETPTKPLPRSSFFHVFGCGSTSILNRGQAYVQLVYGVLYLLASYIICYALFIFDRVIRAEI